MKGGYIRAWKDDRKILGLASGEHQAFQAFSAFMKEGKSRGKLFSLKGGGANELRKTGVD